MPKLKLKPLAVLCMSVIFSSGTAVAEENLYQTQIEKGLAYLISQQNADGSWGKGNDSLMRVTARVVQTLQHYQIKGPIYEKGLIWLANNTAESPESLSRQIVALNQAGIKRKGLFNRLLSMSRKTGVKKEGLDTLILSWGGGEASMGMIRDTSLAIIAATSYYQRPTKVDRINSTLYDLNTARFLKNKRNSKSGWGRLDHTNNKRPSMVIPTAYGIQGLYSVKARYNFKMGGDHGFVQHYGSHAKEGAKWLISVQQASGAISDTNGLATYETAEAMISLQQFEDYPRTFNVQPAIDKGRGYLSQQFLSNGSIQHDLFFSAITLHAMANHPPAWQDSDGDFLPDGIENYLGTDAHTPSNTNLYNTEHSLNKPKKLPVLNAVTGGQLPQLNTFGGKLIRIINSPLLSNNKLHQPGNYLLVYEIEDSQGVRKVIQLPLVVVSPSSDMDRDGMVAAFELNHDLNDYDPADALNDEDTDGLANLEEYWSRTQPHVTDTDHDGIPDGYEVHFGLNPNSARDANQDPDQDGLTNLAEYQYRSHPKHTDSDEDNIQDGDEVSTGRHPAVHEPVLMLILSDML